jgi:hypothetical protein
VIQWDRDGKRLGIILEQTTVDPAILQRGVLLKISDSNTKKLVGIS